MCGALYDHCVVYFASYSHMRISITPIATSRYIFVFGCTDPRPIVAGSAIFFTLFHRDCDDCLPSVRLGVQVARNAGCRNRTSRTLRPPTRPSNHYIHTISYKYTEYDSALVPRDVFPPFTFRRYAIAHTTTTHG